MRHEIGLHFDPTVYDFCNLEAKISKECSWLEDIIGAPVRITAPHRPAANGRGFLGRPGPFAGRLNAYEPRFYSQIRYYSDSSAGWAWGNPMIYAARQDSRSFQLLTHPYLWAQDRIVSQQEKIWSAIKANLEASSEVVYQSFRCFEDRGLADCERR